jgi:hypothetical protein
MMTAQHRRGLLFHREAGHLRHLSARERSPAAPIFVEFDFRYSNRIKLGIDDVARADLAIAGAKGKRLTYQTTRESRSAATAP